MTDPAQPEPQPASQETPPAGLTQEQVNAIATREADKAARAERQRIEAYLEAQKAEQDRAAMDEVDRLRAERDEAQRTAEAAQAAAAAATLAVNVERKLAAAGVAPEALARAARLVTVAPDADDQAITAEIDALKADIPALFTPAAGTTAGTGAIPPAKPPANQPVGQTAKERAAARFAAQPHLAASTAA